MVDQLLPYYKHIHVINNNSTYAPLLTYLESIKDIVTVHTMDKNYGHTVHNLQLFQKYHVNGKYFLTDPDLTLNENLPVNFIDNMVSISEKYKAHRVGFALDIFHPNLGKEVTYNGKTPFQWETPAWSQPIEETVYNAAIDTTFCLVNTNYPNGVHLRIAGNYTCIHRPWMRGWREELLPDELENYKRDNISSCWLRNV